MDIFRKIFGLNRDDERSERQYRRNSERNDFLRDEEHPNDHFSRKGFDIFTDPLQMHQYFEQEMNNILKSFGFQEFGNFSQQFDSTNIPALEASPDDLRDQFLKPGYVKPESPSDMVDKDLDEKVKSGNFDSLLNDKSTNIVPYKPPFSGNRFFSHGTSESYKSIAKPDGSVETHRTKRDSHGNEETTVCHKIGDKEYCVIKQKDAQGNESTTEKYVNMSANEKDIFFKPNSTPMLPSNNPDSGIPWDKFFK
ncbi:unnamed protein product [Phyllotreta striolata]|uniref:HCLS1-associated protein X-1 n=1 Tax=Phyllotreta striolata TaxID=444603 RepID=A0A9N9XRZ1_PHYSR|nr:unnamed protein product [Phyllotreta striolata]